MMDSFGVELIQNIGLPVITAIGGWFANTWRTKQRKEADVLQNVQQVLALQKNYIEEQAAVITEAKNMNKRLEAKLDRKNKSIRQANKCLYTNEGDGCPVLNNEEKYDNCNADCSNCTLKTEENANG